MTWCIHLATAHLPGSQIAQADWRYLGQPYHVDFGVGRPLVMEIAHKVGFIHGSPPPRGVTIPVGGHLSGIARSIKKDAPLMLECCLRSTAVHKKAFRAAACSRNCPAETKPHYCSKLCQQKVWSSRPGVDRSIDVQHPIPSPYRPLDLFCNLYADEVTSNVRVLRRRRPWGDSAREIRTKRSHIVKPRAARVGQTNAPVD
ncbi:hypothetical protein OH76DRAFT_1421706 [Lentinus brumalis]|uniref:MYND-type domain-containing protein n=1 Tax=Lentinus brumalis TaxID=2498619 RepID=A0A371CUC4_9APHY|nr:hypothetical protein OH76DRAFT_1421706 [Polyporus brumalis]